MTIKKRLFFSNLRMVIISIVAFMLAGRIAMFLLYGTFAFDHETRESIRDSFRSDPSLPTIILVITLFIIVVSVINNFITHRMTKRILKPLEPLTEGVRQISNNNLAHRIAYTGNDEFKPICDAFNDMAAKLEAATVQQHKDEANRRELIAGISHDLRTPLTSIKGYLEGIETGVASTPEMKEKYFSIIKNKTADLEHIIEQLFLFSKLDMDEFPVTLRKIDITEAVSDIIEDCRSDYISRGLAIQLTGMPVNTYVSADVLMLRSIIINILENSVKYKTKEQGYIEISLIPEQDSVVLRLTDDGPGVQEEMLPKLFDAFYRGDPSRNKQGSGLGLAICAKIAARMEGSINAELPASGSGISINIRLRLWQD